MNTIEEVITGTISIIALEKAFYFDLVVEIFTLRWANKIEAFVDLLRFPMAAKRVILFGLGWMFLSKGIIGGPYGVR